MLTPHPFHLPRGLHELVLESDGTSRPRSRHEAAGEADGGPYSLKVDRFELDPSSALALRPAEKL